MKKQLKEYILLWSTQSLSALGSGMTGYALVLWLYLSSGSVLHTLFGNGKGSGAAMMFSILGIAGVMVCIVFTLMLKKYKWCEPDI